MHWKICSNQNYQKLEHTFRLPKPLKTPVVAFVLQEEQKVFAVSHNPITPSFPIAYLSWQELREAEVWEIILTLHPLHIADMAYYWHAVLKDRNIEAATIMPHYGLSLHFKNLADWNELGTLSEGSRKLARQYGFPLRILRLWEKLQEPEQKFWLELWQEQPFAKNVIQDIIQDYYELSEKDRSNILEQVKALHQAWNTKPKKSQPFPNREVRDIVRERRSPQIYQAKRTIQKKKRKLQSEMDTQIHLHLPEDLETHFLQLKLNFSNLEQLKTQISSLNKPKVQQVLLDILNSL